MKLLGIEQENLHNLSFSAQELRERLHQETANYFERFINRARTSIIEFITQQKEEKESNLILKKYHNIFSLIKKLNKQIGIERGINNVPFNEEDIPFLKAFGFHIQTRREIDKKDKEKLFVTITNLPSFEEFTETLEQSLASVRERRARQYPEPIEKFNMPQPVPIDMTPQLRKEFLSLIKEAMKGQRKKDLFEWPPSISDPRREQLEPILLLLREKIEESIHDKDISAKDKSSIFRKAERLLIKYLRQPERQKAHKQDTSTTQERQKDWYILDFSNEDENRRVSEILNRDISRYMYSIEEGIETPEFPYQYRNEILQAMTLYDNVFQDERTGYKQKEGYIALKRRLQEVDEKITYLQSNFDLFDIDTQTHEGESSVALQEEKVWDISDFPNLEGNIMVNEILNATISKDFDHLLDPERKYLSNIKEKKLNSLSEYKNQIEQAITLYKTSCKGDYREKEGYNALNRLFNKVRQQLYEAKHVQLHWLKHIALSKAFRELGFVYRERTEPKLRQRYKFDGSVFKDKEGRPETERVYMPDIRIARYSKRGNPAIANQLIKIWEPLTHNPDTFYTIGAKQILTYLQSPQSEQPPLGQELPETQAFQLKRLLKKLGFQAHVQVIKPEQDESSKEERRYHVYISGFDPLANQQPYLTRKLAQRWSQEPNAHEEKKSSPDKHTPIPINKTKLYQERDIGMVVQEMKNVLDNFQSSGQLQEWDNLISAYGLNNNTENQSVIQQKQQLQEVLIRIFTEGAIEITLPPEIVHMLAEGGFMVLPIQSLSEEQVQSEQQAGDNVLMTVQIEGFHPIYDAYTPLEAQVIAISKKITETPTDDEKGPLIQKLQVMERSLEKARATMKRRKAMTDFVSRISTEKQLKGVIIPIIKKKKGSSFIPIYPVGRARLDNPERRKRSDKKRHHNRQKKT